MALYTASSGDWTSLQTKANLTTEDLKFFLEYATQFLGNCGNYKSFGDSKFVPRCGEDVFAALAAQDEHANRHYQATNGAIFSSNNEGLMQLGYPESGHMTTYYPDSKDIKKSDIDAIGAWMAEKGLLAVSLGRIVSLFDAAADTPRRKILDSRNYPQPASSS